MSYRLYHYWRSTSSWRVRWCLAHKKIPHELLAVDLLKRESHTAEHLKRNPYGAVPALEILTKDQAVGSRFLGESFAIIEYLEEVHPSNPILPKDPYLRAKTRQAAEMINAGTQPLQNLQVQKAVSEDPAQQKAWAQKWIRYGLTAVERFALEQTDRRDYLMGAELSLADFFLGPQMYNAIRFEVPHDEFPTLKKIWERYQTLESFSASHPDRFSPR